MKIKRIKVTGLNGHMTAAYDLHGDINVITGLNGSGKTTLLKTMWYLISGNAERIAPEINFDSIELETNLYHISMQQQKGFVQWEFEDDKNKERVVRKYKDIDDPSPRSNIEELNRLTRAHRTSSLYFPTFRRIEGGYSMTPLRRVRRQAVSGSVYYDGYRPDSIQHELESIAERISVDQHNFVCSISTNDIVTLLTRRYAVISESLNNQYKEFSTSIIETIKGAKSKANLQGEAEALQILNLIQQRADSINDRRDNLLRPFTVLSELTAKLFRHRGIKVQAVTLGESVDAIDSAALSAGEKQMLSFLCYNAFSENSIVFIDEPELSLHPDWQRRLFGILLKQQPSNQFIFATHSPFIYTKYEDKEIAMTEDKGD